MENMASYQCMGDDCKEARGYNREHRVPLERADTRIKKFAECSFQVTRRDGRVVEMRGVYSGCDVTMDMEALRPSKSRSGGLKVRKVTWRFVIDREAKSVIEMMGIEAASKKFVGIASNLKCDDCMSRDKFVFLFRSEIQSVQEWMGAAPSSSGKRQRDETDDATIKKAKAAELETEPDACAQTTAETVVA